MDAPYTNLRMEICEANIRNLVNLKNARRTYLLILDTGIRQYDGEGDFTRMTI